MRSTDINSNEIKIYSTDFSKTLSIIILIFYFVFTGFLLFSLDIRNEDNAFTYIMYIIFSFVLYFTLDPITPLLNKPHIILTKEKIWTKSTDWILWKDVLFVNDYTINGKYGPTYYCDVYLKDFSKINILAEYPKEIVKYVKYNFSEKYIPSEKRYILDELSTFTERYSITNEELKKLATQKLSQSTILK